MWNRNMTINIDILLLNTSCIFVFDVATCNNCPVLCLTFVPCWPDKFDVW